MINEMKDLLECVEAAIKAGDWKVDGACDPTMAIERGHRAITKAEKQEPVAKNEGGRITWLVDSWPKDCLLYTTLPISKSGDKRWIDEPQKVLTQPDTQWTPVEIGVDVTDEGTHVVGMYVLMPEVVRHVFYSKFHPLKKITYV